MTKTKYLGFALFACTACDGLAPPEYRGEPLLSVRGSITSVTGEKLDPRLVPAVAWMDDGDDARFLLQDVDVRGDFPANFTLNMLEPPPEGALFEEEGSEMAIGHIIAADPDHPSATSGDSPWDYVKGLSDNYIIIYVDDRVPEGHLLAAYFNGYAEIEVGMHLVEMREYTEEEEHESDRCYEAVYAQIVEEYNEQHGTDFESYDDLLGFGFDDPTLHPDAPGAPAEDDTPALEPEEIDAIYLREEDLAIQKRCPVSKVFMRVVSDPAAKPVSVQIAPDLDEIIDWH